MVKTWEMGGLRVTIEAPDELPEIRPILRVKARDRAEFEAAVEITGGFEGLGLPATEQPYEQSAARSEGGLLLLIEEPPRPGPPDPLDHPFFGAYRDRVGS